jgi:enoyl-CoA hydratase/carnithine racemase
MIKCEFDYSEHGDFVKIKFHGEKRLNIMSQECVEGLSTKLNELSKKGRPIPVILQGNDESFMTGLDINIFSKCTPAEIQEFAGECCRLMDNLESSPAIIISAVNGYCLGGGLELAMATDYIIASDDAKFGLPEIKLGLLPGADGIKRLVRCVGKKRALDLIMSGKSISADEALRIGLINEVVKKRKLMMRAEELAHELSQKNPPAVRAIKKLCNQAATRDITKDEIKAFIECLETEYAKNAINAFLNKK